MEKTSSNPFRRNLTDTQIEDCFAEHLPYEIDMLRGTLELLRRGDKIPVAHFARIESFAIHARNLLEFFMRRGECDFDPRIFTVADYRLLPQSVILDIKLIEKINTQVSHLSKDRTRDSSTKLGRDDWEEISASLEKEIQRFAKSLHKDYKTKWKYNREMILNVIPTSGASSEVYILKSSGDL